jgi:hypothetical protein
MASWVWGSLWDQVLPWRRMERLPLLVHTSVIQLWQHCIEVAA